MVRPRRVSNINTRASSNAFQTRFELLTYAFSRLPPRQLPFLAVYAYVILYASEKGWIDRASTGKAGAAIVGVLSMVTGLLLSYRFSSAISKWDEGKGVWVEVRVGIRDGIRLLSVPPSLPTSLSGSPSSLSSPPVDLSDECAIVDDREVDSTPLAASSDSKHSSPPQRGSASLFTSSTSSTSVSSPEKGKRAEKRDMVSMRVDELAGLMVGFAFALQHHLHQTRPLPQPPLCDLLPTSYLSSLKRTEARVRFAETHAGPSGSTSTTNLADHADSPDSRPGIRRRSTGPPTADDRRSAGEGLMEDWELGNMRDKAEEAVTRLAEAVAGSGGEDSELHLQLSQLNLPGRNSLDQPTNPGNGTPGGVVRPKSNLHSPHPPNLPLALLKLMEAYVIGLAGVSVDKGGWSEARRERGLGIIKSLGAHLGEAEKLCSTPPPLPLTLHLSHLLLIYLAALPCSLLCVVSGKSLILITLIAGWCLLGLDALVGEVGGVFGGSENHHPLPQLTHQILIESLDISPSFMKYYRARLVSRLGEEADEVASLDRRNRRGGEDWLPVFS